MSVSKVVLNRAGEVSPNGNARARTPGPKSAEGPKWYQIVEFRKPRTTVAPCRERSKTPFYHLLYEGAGVVVLNGGYELAAV